MSSSSISSSPAVSSIITGIFSLRDGRRVSTIKPNSNSPVFHNHYFTTISCLNGQRIKAELCVYSTPSDAPLPDETVILAFAKALFPRNRVALLDVIQMSVFPGDPTADTYQDAMPNLTVPVLQALGHVSGPEHKLSGPAAS